MSPLSADTVLTERQDKAQVTRLNRVYLVVIMFCVVQFVFLGLIIVLRVAQLNLEHSLQQVQNGVDAARAETLGNRELGYKNAARVCQIMAATTGRTDQSCQSPEIIRYWDPSQPAEPPSSEGAKANHRVLCDLAAKLGVVEAECTGPFPPTSTTTAPPDASP